MIYLTLFIYLMGMDIFRTLVMLADQVDGASPAPNEWATWLLYVFWPVMALAMFVGYVRLRMLRKPKSNTLACTKPAPKPHFSEMTKTQLMLEHDHTVTQLTVLADKRKELGDLHSQLVTKISRYRRRQVLIERELTRHGEPDGDS